jgi:hypothetical protein
VGGHDPTTFSIRASPTRHKIHDPTARHRQVCSEGDGGGEEEDEDGGGMKGEEGAVGEYDLLLCTVEAGLPERDAARQQVLLLIATA